MILLNIFHYHSKNISQLSSAFKNACFDHPVGKFLSGTNTDLTTTPEKQNK